MNENQKGKIVIYSCITIHILTYLKLTRLELGYLLNFGGALMKNGIIHIVNGLKETK